MLTPYTGCANLLHLRRRQRRSSTIVLTLLVDFLVSDEPLNQQVGLVLAQKALLQAPAHPVHAAMSPW